ncbi:MAG: histidine triad nucleotide-binding protein [Chloroflexi bacterium]|nr:histidine triad nucleotide-binding protein [Chloroflexota bacterium]
MSQSSIFTRIINGEMPGEIVYQDDLVFAIKDIHPKAPVHILIIPREEIGMVNEIGQSNEHIAGRLLSVAAKLAKQFNLDKSGYRLVINNGRDAGQEIKHLHVHLLGGRRLTWPPG